RLGGPASGTGGGDPRRGMEGAAARGGGRGLRPRAERHPRLRGESRGQREVLPGRLVPDRRPGGPRRGGLPASHRSAQGADQPRRREVLAAGGGRRALLTPGGGAGAHLRHASRQARRGGGGGGGAPGGGDGDRARATRLLRGEAGPLQGPAEGGASDRDPGGLHREAPADGSRYEAGPLLQMKVCVVGAGAIGGLVAARLAAQGHQVSVVVRGPHLVAIRARGLTLQDSEGTERVFQVRATDRMSELGEQDLVIIGLKAHQVAGVAADIRGLCGPTTTVVTAQNGIPWWYFFKIGGPH